MGCDGAANETAETAASSRARMSFTRASIGSACEAAAARGAQAVRIMEICSVAPAGSHTLPAQCMSLRARRATQWLCGASCRVKLITPHLARGLDNQLQLLP